MVEKPNIDQYHRSVITEKNICDKLLLDKNFNYDLVEIVDASKYNTAIDSTYIDYNKLKSLEHLTCDPSSWHSLNQNIWFMPIEYRSFDIGKWLLDQCTCEEELQRTAKELLLYAERDLLDLLRYLKYFIDTLRTNKIVWGVGRGSSVASFVLYLIGVHKINSITYNLDIEEFIR
jgi:DNA polymerase III alpha subunit